MRNAFRFKDQILKYMNSKVICKFKYNICSDVYIGETKRQFPLPVFLFPVQCCPKCCISVFDFGFR